MSDTNEVKARIYETWDDAIQNGNENERNMAKNGKALLEEVLSYRQLGTVSEITEVLTKSEEMADRSLGYLRELSEYNKLGTPDDLKLVLHIATCVAKGMTIESFLLNYIENLKDSFDKE